MVYKKPRKIRGASYFLTRIRCNNIFGIKLIESAHHRLASRYFCLESKTRCERCIFVCLCRISVILSIYTSSDRSRRAYFLLRTCFLDPATRLTPFSHVP
jgi:hypothetical protein